MSAKYTDYKNRNEDTFDIIDKLKKEMYSFGSLFDPQINKLLDIMEIYNNKKRNIHFEDEKLKIGVMGQVNSGKSSFLNTLIFNGENILPKDCISKTKIITKINYSNTERLEIEFYSQEEWNEIKNMLIKRRETEGISLIEEIFKFINASEYQLEKYINKNNEIVKFQSYEELLDKIIQYDSKYCNYTFVIKAINIYIDDIRLENIEIIDTPGVNDSNIIRKYTIDKCLKYVDAIFFLSQASIFLDNLDVDLISNQIPMESASNVFLVASKYDTVIIDEGWKFKSLFETDEYIKLRLTNRVNKYVSRYISNSTPIFMSSMASNLALKKKEKYNQEENYIINELNNLWDGFTVNREKLMFIGNFEDIKKDIKIKINDKLDFKENIMFKLRTEIEKILCDIKEISKQRIHIIENSSMKYINIEQEKIRLKTQKIYKGIEDIIENTKELAINKKKQSEYQLEIDYINLCEIKVKKKTILIENEKFKNDPKWYEVFFKKNDKYQIDDKVVEYELVETDEVINKINSFARNADLYVKKMISDIIDFNILKENILKIVCENNEKLKFNDIKAFVENSIGSIRLSNININVEEYINIITSKFKDETTGQMIEVLNINFKAIMKTIHSEITKKIDSEFQLFIFKLDKAQISIMKYILDIVNNMVESLKNEFNDFDRELKSYKKIIKIIET